MATVRESPAREKVRRAPRLRGRLLVAAVLCVTAIAGVLALLGRPYRGTLPPDTRVGGIQVGGRSDADAAQLLAASARPVIDKGMVLTSGSDRFPVSLTRIRIAPDTGDALRRARNVSFVDRIRARLGLGTSRDLDLRYRFDEQALARVLRPARRAVEVAPVEAGVRVGQNGSLKVVRGKGGILIDRVAAGGVAQPAAAAGRAARAAAAARAPVGRQRLGAARAGGRHDAADDAAPGGAARPRLPDPPRRAGEGARLRARGRGGAPEADAPGDPGRDAPAVRHRRGAAAERPVRRRHDRRRSRSSTRPWAARSTRTPSGRRSSRTRRWSRSRSGSRTSSRSSRPRTRSGSGSPTWSGEFTTPYDPGRAAGDEHPARRRGAGRLHPPPGRHVLAERGARPAHDRERLRAGAADRGGEAEGRRRRRRLAGGDDAVQRGVHVRSRAGGAHAARVLDLPVPARARGDRLVGRARSSCSGTTGMRRS